MKLHSTHDLAWRLVLLTLLWWILSGGDPTSWTWGLPVIVVAALVMAPMNEQRWHLMAAIFFIPQALWLTICGGISVARLACGRRLTPDTRVIEYPWQYLPPGPARLFMASLLNLIPGTLTLRLLPDRLTIHVLDYRETTPRSLERLECRIGRLYGMAIPEG